MIFDARDLTIHLAFGEEDGLLLACNVCNSTPQPPKPACPAPSKPNCPAPSVKPPKTPKKRSADLEAQDLDRLRHQLQAALRGS